MVSAHAHCCMHRATAATATSRRRCGPALRCLISFVLPCWTRVSPARCCNLDICGQSMCTSHELNWAGPARRSFAAEPSSVEKSAGAIERILEEPDAFFPLPAVLEQARDDSQNQVDNSLRNIHSGTDSNPAAHSSALSSPAGSRSSGRAGMSAGTTISLDIPMTHALGTTFSALHVHLSEFRIGANNMSDPSWLAFTPAVLSFT